MRNLLIVSVAAVALASPANARDGAFYVGAEGGFLSPASDVEVEKIVFQEGGLTFTSERTDGGNISEVDLDGGHDVALVAGYDFGMFRVEGELSHKRASGGDLDLDAETRESLDMNLDEPLSDEDLDMGGGVTVTSLMANGLLEVGGNSGLGAYAGIGTGPARVKTFGDGDHAWAYQLIAGVRMPLGAFDAGLKYRYFRTARFDYASGDVDTDGPFSFRGDSRFKSHSLLLTLAYNLGR